MRNGGVKDVMKMSICPFCREDDRESKDEYKLKRVMKQAENGEHDDICRIGTYYFKGQLGLQQDQAEGLKWYHRAMEAGDGKAAFILGARYYQGDGVEQDIEKALEYHCKAAELDFIPAFNLIGFLLMLKGEIGEAMLNLRKAAICGDSSEHLFDELRQGFVNGYITREEYAFTLRENQKACNEMKSDARENYKKVIEDMGTR